MTEDAAPDVPPPPGATPVPPDPTPVPSEATFDDSSPATFATPGLPDATFGDPGTAEPTVAPAPEPAALYAHFVARVEAGETLDLEAFCRDEVPEALRDEVRRLHESSRPVQDVMQQLVTQASTGRSVLRRIHLRYGPEADPRVTLAGEPEPGPSREGERRAGGEAEASAPVTAPGAAGGGPPGPGGREGFARYRVEGRIAQGGMGAILKVFDQDLRRPLAMKVALEQVPPPGSAPTPATPTPPMDSRALARFLEEAQVTGQLDHPGIVPVHEIGLDPGGRCYFTMRLVKGRDLRQILELVPEEKEGWTRTRAVGVLLRACEAMAYAHAKKVVHRDLKPGNIMVGRFGEVYVMDWGLARILGREDRRDVRLNTEVEVTRAVQTDRAGARDLDPETPLATMDGSVVGTPAYMPPEQARGDLAHIDRRSDVYSLGAILYHILTGQAPYVPPGAPLSARTILARVLEGPPRRIQDLAPDAPAELEAIGEKAMARDPAGRYADTRELAEDLRAYLEGRVVAAYETGAWPELKKWVKRNRALAAAILAVVLLLAGASVGMSSLYVRAEANAALAEANAAEARANEARMREEKDRADRAAAAAAAEADAARKAREETERQRQVAEAQRREADAQRERAEAQRQEAIARRQEAETERDAKNQALEEVLRLADVKRLQDLDRDQERLWPARPEKVAAMEAWLREARALAGRLPLHEASLAALRASGASGAEATWREETLAELVAGLGSLAAPGRGGIAGVERRLETARTIRKKSLEDFREAWDRAIASIRDPRECPRYGGLVLAPQVGLVPVGRDPRSGLWEFADVQTGTIPRRGRDGSLAVTEDTAVVFVLLPGGSFPMGARAGGADASNADPLAEPDESPVTRVTLDPFFLAKDEMTQGQWLRSTGENPSSIRAGTDFGGTPVTLLHPVESVSWEDARRALEHLGWRLPTEAQWEYAARAGTTSPWWTGSEPRSLDGAANLADRVLRKGGGLAKWDYETWLDDGHAVHAPVGRFRANGFGLRDVLGNVSEWCRDGYGRYTEARGKGDGELQVDGAPARVYRGGGWKSASDGARSANRDALEPSNRSNSLGVRPARGIE